MILIISHKTDFSADYVVNILNQRGTPYRRLNCEDVLNSDLRLSFGPDFSYSILGEVAYDSVWFRRTKLPELDLPSAQRAYILFETDSLLKNLFATIAAKWLSIPHFVYEAENKLLQLKAARDVGFTIPETLVTQSKAELRSFYARHDGNLIVKPLAQTRLVEKENASFIFTNRLAGDVFSRLDDLDLSPCVFQKNIPKDYELRVTVVGTKVFAARVDSQDCENTRIDWRKEHLRFEPVVLPAKVSDMCIMLLRQLQISFGAIDIIRTPSGDHVFLEINPNGQWVWIENQTGLRIADAIIEYLTDVEN